MFDFKKLKDNPELVYHVAPHLKKDKDFILKCVSVNGNCINWADPSLHQDTQIVHTAITNSPLAYAFIDNTSIRDDRELAKIALLNNGLALQFLSEKLKDDEHLVEIAMAQNPLAFLYASNRIKHFHLVSLDKTKLHIHIDTEGFATFFLPKDMSKEQLKVFKVLHLIKEPSWFLSLVLWIELLFKRLLNKWM